MLTRKEEEEEAEVKELVEEPEEEKELCGEPGSVFVCRETKRNGLKEFLIESSLNLFTSIFYFYFKN